MWRNWHNQEDSGVRSIMKKFDIASSTVEADGVSIRVVGVQGYLDSSTFPELQEHLESLIAEGHYRILVELGHLNYISSAGIGVLMGMLQEVRAHDGDLKLANLSPKIKNLFDMLGFSRLIRIYDGTEEAKEAFKKEIEQSTQARDSTADEENY